VLVTLNKLNDKLLESDSRLEKITETLADGTAEDLGFTFNGRNHPTKWGIFAMAPLKRHGQGVQGLLIVFLFQVFVNHLLGEVYEKESEPVLILEEPETHLHPQAIRALWNHISVLLGQKIVTAYSTYFVQHVPFRALRLVHLNTKGRTTVRSLPASFSALLPTLDGIESVVVQSGKLLTCEPVSKTLTVHGELNERTYRKLLSSCAQSEHRTELQPLLRDLRDRSRRYVKDDELKALENYALRMRGEIFFSRNDG